MLCLRRFISDCIYGCITSDRHYNGLPYVLSRSTYEIKYF